MIDQTDPLADSIHAAAVFQESLADVWLMWATPINPNIALRLMKKTALRLTDTLKKFLVDDSRVPLYALQAVIWKNIQQRLFDETLCRVWTALGLVVLSCPQPEKYRDLADLPASSAAAELVIRDIAIAIQGAGLEAGRLVDAGVKANINICRYWVDELCGANLKMRSHDAANSPAMQDLSKECVEVFCPVGRKLHAAMGLPYPTLDDKLQMATFQGRWNECARQQLAFIRAEQIYDILHLEDKRIKARLLSDLVDILQTPSGRAIVDKGLQSSFSKHLLHNGSRTVDVLDDFMLVLQTLTQPLPSGRRVDESGVLLDRAARTFKRYLSKQDDAAKIVISSLLDPQPEMDGLPPPSHDNFSGRISMAMFYQKNPHTTHKPYEGKDLLDPEWLPEPIDALSTHRINTEQDPIGHITSVQKDSMFIMELENVLGERLLRSDKSTFHTEQRLLAMFRARFDEQTGDRTKIQPSDVMLSDMQESLRWKEKIAAEAGFDPSLPPWGNLHVKIISKFFWRDLRDRRPYEVDESGSLVLPRFLGNPLGRYEIEFSELTKDRCLEWFHDLGRVTMVIDFVKRASVTLEASTVQAAVLEMFSQPDDDHQMLDTNGDVIPRFTVHEIAEQLKMDESAVRDCCSFWSRRKILGIWAGDATQDTYYLIDDETVDAYEDSEDAVAVETQLGDLEGNEDSEFMTQRERLEEHEETYAAYIISMLTNRGAMPAEDILHTLSMFVPGGFAHDLNDLTALLERIEAGGNIMHTRSLWTASLGGDHAGSE